VATSRDVIRWIGRSSKRAVITVVGFVLIIGGIILLPLPGPGWLVIILGLAVLATEYVWAERALDAAKRRAKAAAAMARARLRRGRTNQEPKG
jgi:uncharacterized protein (TIGR02611 family)